MKTKEFNFLGFSNQYWWLMFSAGVLFVCLGVWILASPVHRYESLGLLFAFGLIFSGFFEIIFAVGNHRSLQKWGLTLLAGIVDLFLGIYLIKVPLLTLMIMPLVLGLWLLFRGCMAINSTLSLRAYGVLDWVWLLFTGALIILLTLLIMGSPLVDFVNPVIWTAFCFILSGLFRVYLSLQLSTDL
jgi:uncharacterized membrane protein HdeD (DUF308 family)